MLDIRNFIEDNFEDAENYGNPITDLRVNCPFCADRYGKEDHKHKLHISLYKHVVHCFRCSYKNNWVGFVIDVLDCNYHQALSRLYSVPNPKRIRQLFYEESFPKRQPYELDIDIVPLISDKKCKYSSAVKKYATKRGLDKDKWKSYNLSASNDLPYRLIIPVEDDYYQARAIYPWLEPKYINPKSEKDSYIFNSSALYLYDEIVICEGVISAISVGLNSIATLGVDITSSQIERLKHANVRHYILVSEPNTEQTTVKNADKLSNAGKEVSIWKYEDGDPAESKSGYVEYGYDLKSKLQLLLS